MNGKRLTGSSIFFCFNYIFLIVMALLCIMPIIHIFAVSLSSSQAAAAGFVNLWPIGLNFKAYAFVMNKPEFIRAFSIAVERLVLGTAINMVMTVLVAYPLSKDTRTFKLRTAYVWIFVITILVNGGLIPWYMTIRYYGLIDSIWALVLPGAVPVFNAILLLNFFRGIPKELEEAAFIDGAGHWTIMYKIFVPLAKPALATVALYAMVWHWNSWFDGLILMNRSDNYPLQTYLQTKVINFDMSIFASTSADNFKDLSNRTVRAAQIFVGSIPILLTYPILQKYFVKGIVMGSVKG